MHVPGAGVKESVLTVPLVYTAYLILAGEDVRRKIPWLAILIAAPIASWILVRRVLGQVHTAAEISYWFGLWSGQRHG